MPVPNDPTAITDYSARRQARGYTRNGKKEIKITFGSELWNQIESEASRRGWPIARMVRHLCEASIEGIE